MVDFTRDELFSTGDIDLQVAPVLKRLAASTGANGELVPDMPIPNSSFNVDFLGPSLQCRTPDQVLEPLDGPMKVSDMIWHIYNATAFRLGKEPRTRWKTLNTSGAAGAAVYIATSPSDLWTPGPMGTSKMFEQVVQECVVGAGSCEIMGDGTYMDALWIQHQDELIACALHETKYHVGFRLVGTTPKMILQGHEPLGTIRDPLRSYLSLTQSLVDLLTGVIGFQSTEADCFNLNEEVQGRPLYDMNASCATESSFLTIRTKIWSTLLVGALNLTYSANLPGSYNDMFTRSISPEDRALARNLNLGPLIEELSRNLTLNLFSNPHFL
ncbi:MAG: hypothetical protein Q9168_007777 [Polycauliona sp. 1 TL-2023]